MLASQDNQVTYLVPWTHLQKPPKEGGKPRPHGAKVCIRAEVPFKVPCVAGAYELVSYQMGPGGPAVWGKDFQAAISAHDAPGYGKVLAAFHSEFGRLNTGKGSKRLPR